VSLGGELAAVPIRTAPWVVEQVDLRRGD